MTRRRVAVVGAGIAGLACAVRLDRGGIDVTVFDKGRRPGGRMATRRLDGAQFDHGAQFVSAHGHDLGAALAEWATAGVAAIWPAAGTDHAVRWVGRPGMAGIPAHLAGLLARPPEQDRQVGFLHRATEGWRLRHAAAADTRPGAVFADGGDVTDPFDAVLVTAPAPQAAGLLATAGHRFAEQAGRAGYDPCWTLLASFSHPLDVPDVVRAEAGPVASLAREASRPGRAATPERFVVHASAPWSRQWLERDAADVADALLAALRWPAPTARLAHRWRYARVNRSLETPCLWDAEAGLGAAGDWCLGGRVEAAWDSGRALADAVLAA